MPVYDYLCSECGPFSEIRPMVECDLPLDCPHCGSEAPRAILTAPRLGGMSRELMLAHATNEKSRHAPSTLSALKADSGKKKHGAGCSCCSGGMKSRTTLRRKDGSKSFPTARPWMISH
ncbi:MAG: zinc ribbon domain-containing protein [Pseudomonadota bacterium]